MAKVLVTGAAGFIGSHVTRLLVEQGRSVKALIKKGERTQNIANLPVEIIEGDILDAGLMESALQGCDTLYHLAAIYAVWHPNEKIIYDVNVRGSEIVLEAARKVGIKKVVYTSSIAGIGLGSKEHPADEGTKWNYGWMANAYIKSKYQGQLVALRYARQGLPVTIVNPAFPFGDQDIAPTPTGQIILDVVNGKVPAYIDGGFNMIDVRDVAAGHLLAEKKGRVGETYILGNRNVTLLELYQMIGKISGVKVPSIRIPSSVVLATALLAEQISNRITHRPPIATFKSVLVSTRYMYYDPSKAVRELGLNVTPVEAALERAIDWFRANGHITKNLPSLSAV